MEDREVRRAGDWFRIGFAPVFVDYTKRGAWFVVILLAEVSGLELTSAPLLCQGVPCDRGGCRAPPWLVVVAEACSLASCRFPSLRCIHPRIFTAV